MHKRIFDMIAYCRQKGLRSEISTNATLLDERKAKGLLDAGLNVIYLCLTASGPRPTSRSASKATSSAPTLTSAVFWN